MLDVLRQGPFLTAPLVGHLGSTLPVVLILMVALTLADQTLIGTFAVWAVAWL